VTATLGIGIVGAGMMGSKHARTIVDELSGADLVALADVDRESAAALADSLDVPIVYNDAEELIADSNVEAVVIASNAETHDELVLACFDADKAVFCEKPLSPTAARSRRVAEVEVALGRQPLQLGFQRRFDAGYRELKRLLDGGEVGTPLLMHCAHRNIDVPEFVTSEIALVESVVHEVDTIRWLLGQEIVAVTVFAPLPTRHAPAPVRDPQLVLFETDGRVLITVESFMRGRYGYHVRCEVVGEEGALELPPPAAVLVAQRGRQAQTLQGGLERFAQAFRDELQAWVEGVHAGRSVGAGAWDGYAASAVMEACARAASTGERTAVELGPAR
jgi:myo-inositol 2-dehydrogenase / D-chiro-inositol 1-dehydrogenase